jgi:hypothetical protein
LERETATLKSVFRGKQEVLCAKLEERLYGIYETRVKDLDDAVRLSFAIGGFVRVVKDYLFATEKIDVGTLKAATLRMLKLLLPKNAATHGSTV